MLGKHTISLILPCRNEEQALPILFSRLPKGIDEIIIIDNGSTDNTAAVAKKLGAVVLHEPRQKNGIGYGYAIMKGLKHATGDILACMDADGSYPVQAIPTTAKTLLYKNYDFISCNRLPFQRERQMSKIRMSGVRILNLTIGMLFRKTVNDSLSGMWVFRKSILPFLSLSEGDWNFSLQIKLNALLHPDIRFFEYSIPYNDRVFGSSKQEIFKTGLRHTFYLFKFRFLRIKRQIQLPAFPLFSLKTDSK